MVVTVTPCRLHQARAALDLPGAAPRRQGPLRHGDARRGFRHPPVRRQHAHAGAVLLLARPGLQAEGLAPAARGAAGARQGAASTCCRSSRASASPRSCRCPRTRRAWETLDVMFATASGTVRRNKLSDFVQVNRAGKIAMKLDEGDEIVDVQICTEADDVLLTTALGQCIRFPVAGRARLQGPRFDRRARHPARRGRPRHLDGDPAPCRGEPGGARRLSQAGRARCARAGSRRRRSIERARPSSSRRRRASAARSSSAERYAEMGAAEQFILTVSENGYGKRTSSYEYRITGTRRQGHRRHGGERAQRAARRLLPGRAMTIRSCWSPTAARLIRVPVDGIRIAGRAHAGRHRVQHRRRRARRLGRAHRGRGRGGERGGLSAGWRSAKPARGDPCSIRNCSSPFS